MLTSFASLLLLGGFIAWAWEHWPVALRYREREVSNAARATIGRYLRNQDSLSLAACQLATQLRRLSHISLRLASVEPAQSKRISPPGLVPAGIDPADPRFEELTFNALRLSLPADMPPEVRTELERLNDSVMKSRGFRIVQCAA
jgi:hypothetical protein